MTQSTIVKRGRAVRKLREIGSCLELVPMDPHFNSVSVGLYYKEGTCTVWSFSEVDGIENRLKEIRDQMVRIGGVQPLDGSDNQFIFPCGVVHMRPVKFLLTQAVTKASDFAHPKGSMTIKDSKSNLMLTTTGASTGEGYSYHVSGEGDVKNPALEATDGGRWIHALRRDGEDGRFGSRLLVRLAARRASKAPSTLLTQHQRGRVDAGSGISPRPDDHEHAGLHATVDSPMSTMHGDQAADDGPHCQTNRITPR